MGKKLSLFNDYHTKENILSNHCGLILKLLYEENPKSFEEVIAILTGKDFVINPSFEQQVRKTTSVPDIVIEQKSFSIYFETKQFDWFYDDQIDRHLAGFKRENDYNILFLIANFQIDDLEEKFKIQIEKARRDFNITLCPISFEQLIGILETVESTRDYKTFLIEFRDFLEQNNYLPTWKHMLDVENCSGTIKEVHEHDVYMCPDTGGMYNHQRALYFGGYKNKNVKYLHEIKALVVVERGGSKAYIKWKNVDIEDKTIINEALQKVRLFEYRINEIQDRNLQVFILHNRQEVNFRKVSDGGLYGSKKYFKNIAKKYNANNVNELAEKLRNETWE